MSMSESMKKAQAKYKKTNVVNVALQFNKRTEQDLIQHVMSYENKTSYIKALIRRDIADQSEHQWFLHVDTEWNGDEFGRTFSLSAKTEADARAEAEKIKRAFGDFVAKQDPQAEWNIWRAIKDPYSMSGYREVGDPIVL